MKYIIKIYGLLTLSVLIGVLIFTYLNSYSFLYGIVCGMVIDELLNII